MTEVTELLNLWGETVEQCARRMLAGATRGLVSTDEPGTPRERARQHAERIAVMAHDDARKPLPGQLDPAFYTRVADYLARDV